MAFHRKLTPEQVLELRRSTGHDRALAKKLGVARSTISRIRAWREYADVRGPGDPMTVAWLMKCLSRQDPHGVIDPETLSIDIVGIMGRDGVVGNDD